MGTLKGDTNLLVQVEGVVEHVHLLQCLRHRGHRVGAVVRGQPPQLLLELLAELGGVHDDILGQGAVLGGLGLVRRLVQQHVLHRIGNIEQQMRFWAGRRIEQGKGAGGEGGGGVDHDHKILLGAV